MKGWRPRPASAGLRNRIFACEAEQARTAAYARERFDVAALTRWLAPALGCFILATATLVQPDAPARAASLGPVEGREMAFSIATGHSGHNNIPATAVEWTFGRHSASNSDSFVGSETNQLRK
jgi:hypothetical protein